LEQVKGAQEVAWLGVTEPLSVDLPDPAAAVQPGKGPVGNQF
jgi:hypothetical protein